mgnify:CR=1 FL=1
MRSCCCTGYLTNPGGVCCVDLPAPAMPWVTTTPPKFVQVGWKCPVCEKGNAPIATYCYHCAGEAA